MAINFCALCQDTCTGKNTWIGNNNSQETWRLLIAQVLCGLQSSIVSPIVPLPEVIYDFETLESDYGVYASSSFLNGQTSLKKLRVHNTTNAGIEFSLDAGNSTFMTVLAGEDTGFINLGNVVVTDPEDFQLKRVSGESTTSGSLYIQGSY